MIEYENLALLNHAFAKEFEQAFSKTVKKGWFILGNEVQAFEQEFATYCGAKYCVGLANGLDALILSLRALQIPPKSEVIVPSNTYIATILAVLQAGLVPVLVEPDIETYNIKPQCIEELITPKTKAIMPVHLYGKLADMQKIMSIAKTHNLKVISDCAQAHGASCNTIKAGAWADIAAFSFYPTKNLGSLGDGGAIVTNSKEYYDTIKTLRNYGSRTKYYNELIGYNSRLDEIQAAFLRIKFKKLESINSHKRALAEVYLNEITNSNIILPEIQQGYLDVFHIFPIRHSKRDALKEYLLTKEIKTDIHYPVAPHKQQAMEGLFTDQYPISEEIHSTILSLPISYIHTKEEIYKIAKTINNYD